jgi:eukaryotic-like serine/threonine-protein kinase
MAQDDFRVGGWLARPSLDRLELADQSVHLRPKTMQVLVALARHPGEVVSREDLYGTVWAGVHVSNEGLNHCIAELRAAFGDEAHAPRFVQTVAKHGYRLVAPVGPAAIDPPQDPISPESALVARDSRTRLGKLRRTVSLGLPLVAIAVLFLSALFGTKATVPAHGAPRLTVLLADWKGEPNDRAFNLALRQTLAMRLSQSSSVRLLSRESVASALNLMRRPATTPIVDATAQEVCDRLGGDVVIDSEVTGLGKKFVITLAATGCGGGREAPPIRRDANGREQILTTVDRAAAELLDQLQYARPRNAAQPRPDEEVTTAKPEALRVYSLASDELSQKGVWETISLYEHAVSIDPDFALAHSRLATILGSIREWKHANEHRERALDGLKGLTEREQLYVKASHELGHGRFGEAEAELTTWTWIYPHDRVPLDWLAVGCMNRGERARALGWTASAVAAAPPRTQLSSLAALELSLGRVAEAETIAKRSPERGLLFVLAFLRRDAAGMKQQAEAVAAGSFEELDMRARQAQAAAAVGNLHDARQFVGDAERIGLRMGLKELTSQIFATQAAWEAELGNGPLATGWATASLSLDDNPTTEALAVLACARLAAVPRAEDLLRRFTAADSTVDPAILAGSQRKLHAAVELARGRPDAAIENLAGLASYEYGGAVNLVALRGDVAELGVFHLRGLAFLALGQGGKAAAEFQKIIDNRCISPLSPYAALAPLNLGRARALEGDLPAALQAYAQFCDCWRGADADVKLAVQARREYEKLLASTKARAVK